jgi:hypothetical protein
MGGEKSVEEEGNVEARALRNTDVLRKELGTEECKGEKESA